MSETGLVEELSHPTEPFCPENVIVEFFTSIGYPEYQEPHPRDFPAFARFLNNKYPLWADAAFELWNEWCRIPSGRDELT